MRQIKFRAWDKTNNKWYMEGDTFDLNYSGSYGDFFFNNDHPSNMRSVKLEWVQFTGLHDRLGKEIYEGDRMSSSTRASNFVIYWFDGGFRGRYGGEPIKDSRGFEFDQFEADTCEVIGNIYESLDTKRSNR